MKIGLKKNNNFRNKKRFPKLFTIKRENEEFQKFGEIYWNLECGEPFVKIFENIFRISWYIVSDSII
jgi:hypothetical protein